MTSPAKNRTPKNLLHTLNQIDGIRRTWRIKDGQRKPGEAPLAVWGRGIDFVLSKRETNICFDDYYLWLVFDMATWEIIYKAHDFEQAQKFINSHYGKESDK